MSINSVLIERLTEFNEDLPISHSLIWRESENTSNIIVFTALFLLWDIYYWTREKRGRETGGKIEGGGTRGKEKGKGRESVCVSLKTFEK